MAETTNKGLPSCGLYRTIKPLPGHEEQVPAGVLVYFHNHSDSGLPQVLTPDHNIHNRWHFHGPAVLVRGQSWVESLQQVPSEGFYVLSGELTFNGGKWPKSTLVQLGYTRQADPILFVAQVRGQLQENDLWFSDQGVAIPQDQLAILEPIVIYQEQGTSASDDSLPKVH